MNVATARPGGPNELPALMRRWFGPTAGQPGTRHRVELVPQPDGQWKLRQRAEVTGLGEVIPLGQLDYYEDLRVACGVAGPQFEGHDTKRQLAVQSSRRLDSGKHFVVRVSGDSMDGGHLPIRDGDLVLCEWVTVTDPAEVEGRAVLLTGGTTGETLAYLKVPVRQDGRWVLRSANPTVDDLPIEPDVTLRVVARVLEVVEERRDPV
ncbi:MAG: S24 family peptidase, partial [Deltaproteobacteria bacterium]|nr:S24 family peptidase [Deltaproteobacteria bacterium]